MLCFATRYRRVNLLLAVSLLALQGCATPPAATVPMRALRIDPVRDGNDTLIVMLPGVRDRAEQFIQSGFVDGYTGREFDLIAADAHWGYYSEGSIVERLREDVIGPAQARGYENIWLLGVSLGGFGSVLYAQQFPDDIQGVVLLAPYLGGRRLAKEIADAGGLASWSGTSTRAEPFEVEAWRWLKMVCVEDNPNVILGYGDSDRLVPTYGPLIEALPDSQIHTIEGGHNWATWAPLWDEIKAADHIP